MLNDHGTAFRRLEDQKRELLCYLDGLTEEERSWRASSKELSPIQVLAHVVKVEETVSGAGTAPPPRSKVLLKGRIFMLTMVNLMRPGFRIPTMPVLHPKSPDSYEGLKRTWDKTRRDLASRIDGLSEATRHKPVTNHMMAGPLSASMALEFLDVHLSYHWKNFPRPNRAPSLKRK